MSLSKSIQERNYLKRMSSFASHELQRTLQNRMRVAERLFPNFLSLFFVIPIVHHHYVQNLIHSSHFPIIKNPQKNQWVRNCIFYCNFPYVNLLGRIKGLWKFIVFANAENFQHASNWIDCESKPGMQNANNSQKSGGNHKQTSNAGKQTQIFMIRDKWTETRRLEMQIVK